MNLHGSNVTEKVAARQSRATAIDSAPFGARFKISDISDITNRKYVNDDSEARTADMTML